MYTVKTQGPEGRFASPGYFWTEGKNKYGEVKSVTDRNGNKTAYAIDGRGNIV